MKAIVYVGSAGSGKSTAAREYVKNNPGSVIIERDVIRKAHGYGPVGTPEQEKHVTKVQRGQIEAALLDGFTPVISDTNTNRGIRNAMIRQIHKYGADVEVRVIHPSLATTLTQNAQRGDAAVPADIVRKMWDSVESQRESIEDFYPLPQVSDYSHAGRPKVVTVDIDGTVADSDGVRSPYDYTKVGLDRPHENVIEVVRALGTLYPLVFVSGRKDSCRADTEAWLDKHVTEDYTLYMRRHDDSRADWEVKNEIYDNDIIPNYDVLAVLDDRQSVTLHLRKKGLTVMQVAPGRF